MQPLTLYVLDLSRPAGDDPDAVITRREVTDAVLRTDDLGVTRGDGIFETILVHHGLPQAMDPHLDRFARSAAMMDLPVPERELWRRAVEVTAAEMAPHAPFAAVKFVMTRGVETEEIPTGFAYGFVPDDPTRARLDGIDVVLLDRGYRHDVSETSPWLLQGAKTLAYAINKAALREAARRGAHDVIFVSSDGYVLEGPNSTLIARIDSTYVTIPTSLGVLPGTTQGDVFAALDLVGAQTRVGELFPADLSRADAMWLCSSTRGAAPVRSLDGTPVAVDHDVTAMMNDALGARER
ncbi:aminodeoxychorismate lyase [Gordonia amarae]|uniref:Aminodeoxychorismate lyase n=2 Tax=Gordonia amarae TaxID=36821 RepID=A0A857MIB6_9ACTN|nr:aminotransferase class IV [Gordonia amarae]MCS3878404.1 4-amino-4-deoxychorismate lyase [Gordonia amarae]QHN17034.1 aminodeoxychorismate lyase [Gordonia amarae]QHN21560.1 aminodeoxychorismate lyase [Gordonia amarae]QHN30410.1 aminodeoxychorismate lyase [Gordonia amarae]QHN39187.1 aminodeoxychorismate lyase [Gordonia amarae]